VTIRPRVKLRAKAKGENVNLDPAPAPDEEMPELMEKHHNAQNKHEWNDVTTVKI
jgi:hypothetical protein